METMKFVGLCKKL